MKVNTFIVITVLSSCAGICLGGFAISDGTPSGMAAGLSMMALSIVIWIAGAIGGAESRIIRALATSEEQTTKFALLEE